MGIVPQGGTALITLDFNLEESLHIVKKGKQDSYMLRPVVNVVGFEQGISDRTVKSRPSSTGMPCL